MRGWNYIENNDKCYNDILDASYFECLVNVVYNMHMERLRIIVADALSFEVHNDI